MNKTFELFMNGVGIFFLAYLFLYASYLSIGVIVGAWQLYKRDQMTQVRNQLKNNQYVPISIIVPAYNEEVTIVDSIHSLLKLDYQLYEIIIVDDGSKDHTTQKLLDSFPFLEVKRPICINLKTQPYHKVYETTIENIPITLICKENGGKGDSLNMGINASRFPYFICIDADSLLQKDSLEKIVQPVLEDENVVAVGGLIRIAQGIKMKSGIVQEYKLTNNPIVDMQILEYDRSFLTSKILMDQFNGNLIISGAFGLFKKDIVVACGGYDNTTLGEDMELVVKLHVFCRHNQRDYTIKYEPNAVCWSQAPSGLGDLMKQRRRWYLGLFQSMMKYSHIFMNVKFGLVSFISYLYYLLFELLSPAIEVFGIVTVFVSYCFGILNFPFLIRFLLLYCLFGAVLTLTSFFHRVYTKNIKIGFFDVIKAIIMCLAESLFFRFILSFVRVSSFIGYKNKKHSWGSIKRVEHTHLQD